MTGDALRRYLTAEQAHLVTPDRKALAEMVKALRARLAEAEARLEGGYRTTEQYAARAEAAEARAQRYREALEFYARSASHSVARRALSADPLVCRDPDLCWGTGTCPRDPACNE